MILLFYQFIHELTLLPNSWNMAEKRHQRTSPKKLRRLFYFYIWCCKRYHQRSLENFKKKSRYTIYKGEYYNKSKVWSWRTINLLKSFVGYGNCWVDKTGIYILKFRDFAYHSCQQDFLILMLPKLKFASNYLEISYINMKKLKILSIRELKNYALIRSYLLKR